MDIYECRLVFHRKNKPADDEILFNAKEFPSIKLGCLLEIYQSENEKHHLIKIESINQNCQLKETISFDQHLANSYRLTANKILKFRIIDESMVTLDVLDIIIKDQYLSRSDMYRFTNSIRNSVLQVTKKLDFGPYRGTVGEMWCQGQRNHSGYFAENSRVVFRSAAAVVHIFIQMSSEMWEFDYFGELYFDKAINFISDLFNKWNENNCGHDVTIVLFSRLYYLNLDPGNVQRNINIDHQGRYYEDFYIVVVQNERYVIGEWRKVIKTLKFRFNNYKCELDEFQQKYFPGSTNIGSYLTTAKDANFLETLNITLNLYENYYIDRNFERTGKICVVITAGSGVYNVDRVQAHLTKQRICDLGVGMDLVCIGEQPLHAVPLFIFHQKVSSSINDRHYYIPYWINHSFYRSVNELQAIQMGKFIPRIKVKIEKNLNVDKVGKNKEDCNSEIDLSGNALNYVRKLCKPDVVMRERIGTVSISTSGNLDKGLLFVRNNSSHNSKDDSYIQSFHTGSKKPDITKALFNPFAPNRFNVRTTSNSRRWSHVFPIDKNNKPIQLHHQLALNTPNIYRFENQKTKSMVEAWKNYYKLFNMINKPNEPADLLPSSPMSRDRISISKYHEIDESEILTEKSDFPILSDKPSDDSMVISPLPSSFQGGGSQKSFLSTKGSINRRVHTLFTEGEQKWSWDQPKEDESPINHMGVDWKSLTLPAILPITSDYYPSHRVFEDEFLESNYQLMADSLDVNNDSNSQPRRKPLGINEVFQELIFQRLNQGFQLITTPPIHSSSSSQKDNNKRPLRNHKNNDFYRFGLGRIFHTIEMKQDLINVTQYSPRHINNLDDMTYNYCLKMPDSKDYMICKTRFSTQMLEKFNWNYHDHYILNYGGNSDEDIGENGCRYKLIPSLKYWRSRFYLLPLHSATRTIIDSDKNTKIRCDIYDEKSVVEQNSLIEEFFKFLESLNKIRRTQNSKKPTIQSACVFANVNSMSPIRSVTQRHSATNDPNLYSQLQELAKNSSNPVTPNEKFPRQFTFETIDNAMKSSSGYELDKLTDVSPVSKVLDEMMSSQNGLTFLPSTEFANEYTFTSYEAVNWCIRKIDKITDVKSAVIYLQKLMNLRHIYHASEYGSHKFIYGFVFYCLNISSKSSNNSWIDVRNMSNANSSSNSLMNLALDESDNTIKSSRRPIEWVEVYLSSIEMDGKSERDWISEYLEKPFTVGFHLHGESSRRIDSLQNSIFFSKRMPNRYLTNCLTHQNIYEYIGKSHDPGMLFEKNGVLYKKVVIDINNDRNDRPEWSVFQYQANYHPTMAFEIMFQWLVATGGKLADKITNWSRRTSLLQLVPVPCDPFALPSSINSDPLRGPIFVPMNVSCLIDDALQLMNCASLTIGETINQLFADFPEEERLYRFLLFQEAILKRFGFIRESCVNYSSKEYICADKAAMRKEKPINLNVAGPSGNMSRGFSGGTSFNWSYIHYSGGMFAMIPSYDKYRNDISDQMSLAVNIEDFPVNFASSNIRHVNTDEDSDEWETTSIGFLWSWNKMLTRKWTTSATVIDEQFQDRMLADFREFCVNSDDRLKKFYFDAKAVATNYFCDSNRL